MGAERSQVAVAAKEQAPAPRRLLGSSPTLPIGGVPTVVYRSKL